VTEISKKELLSRTGISYGQLYRWKRERLIPEEWFIKRSAVTGQETYFPREQILDRVEAIIELKEDHSLEEIRKILSSEHSTLLTRARVESLGILPSGLFERVDALSQKSDFKRGELALLVMLVEVAADRGLKDAELDGLISRSLPLLEENRSANSLVIVIDAAGTLHVVLAREGAMPLFDRGLFIVRSALLADLVAKLKVGKFDGPESDAGEGAGAGTAADTDNTKYVNVTVR